MRLSRALVAASALAAIGCAPGREPQRDSEGLVRIRSGKPGNLFAHPSVSIDDYDDIWLAAMGIQYAEGQEPFPEPDERLVRKTLYDVALEEVPAVAQLAARQAGPCTLKAGVHLAALAFERPGYAGPRSRGSALVIFELRDSETGEPLVRYGQRRDLAGAARRTNRGPDLERLEEMLHVVLGDADTAMRNALPVNPSGARAGQGCKGVIGDVRSRAKSAAR